jgi:hypothetical protein
LQMLPAGGGRRVLGELEYEVEDVADVLRKVRDMGVEVTVIDCEEADLIVLERHELREVRGADAVQIFRQLATAGAHYKLQNRE